MRRAASLSVIAASGGLGLAFALGAPAAGGNDASVSTLQQFVYRTEAHDTLIGLSRRLLLDPRRWVQLQQLNHILDPVHMPRALALLIPYDWLKTTPEWATVVAVSGTVQNGALPLLRGAQLSPGSVVVTGADGSATLALADGSTLTLQPSSVLRLDRMAHVTGVPSAHDAQLKLDSGRVETHAQPQRDVGRFEISTPVAVTAVRGTRFRDSFDTADAKARAETLEGNVHVAVGENAVPVPAGFGTRAEAGAKPLTPVPLLPPPDLASVPNANSESQLQVRFGSLTGAAAYRVQLSRDEQFQAIVAERVSPTNAVAFAGLADGDYWLRARGIDGLGIEGNDAVTGIRQHYLPPPPRAIGPGASTRVNGSRTRLEWASSGVDTRYRLQVAREESFASPLVERSDLLATTFELQNLSPGQYFWRMSALSAAGEAGAWSEPQNFIQRPAPSRPESPQLTAHELQIHWSGDVHAYYRLQISHDAAFRQLILEQQVEGSSWTMPKPRLGTYYARVQAFEGDGSTDGFGPVCQFDVQVPHWIDLTVPVVMPCTLIR